MNVVIIGFMGSGKSTVGHLLADKMGMAFVDTDQLVENKTKKKIHAIFKENGESFFRKMESEALLELKGKDGIVLSTGGGIVLKQENLALLKKIGKVVLLWAEPEVVYERVKESKQRPLLNVSDPKAEIVRILEERKPHYQKAADYIVDTSKKTPREIVEEIKAWLK